MFTLISEAVGGLSPKLTGTIFLPPPQHKQRSHLQEIGLHRHLLPNLLVVHHTYEFSKPAGFGLGQRAILLKLCICPAQL